MTYHEDVRNNSPGMREHPGADFLEELCAGLGSREVVHLWIQ